MVVNVCYHCKNENKSGHFINGGYEKYLINKFDQKLLILKKICEKPYILVRGGGGSPDNSGHIGSYFLDVKF